MMLKWALIFLAVAALSGALGFTGLAGAAVGIAKFLTVLALIIFAILFVLVFKTARDVSETMKRNV